MKQDKGDYVGCGVALVGAGIMLVIILMIY